MAGHDDVHSAESGEGEKKGPFLLNSDDALGQNFMIWTANFMKIESSAVFQHNGCASRQFRFSCTEMGQAGSAFPFRLGASIDQGGAPGMRLFEMHQGTHPVRFL
jgi:hypothetical protein